MYSSVWFSGISYLYIVLASPVTQTVKNLQETRVQSLGQEDSLEKGMAMHSSILAYRIPRTEEPSELQVMGLHRVRHVEQLTLSLLCLMEDKT